MTICPLLVLHFQSGQLLEYLIKHFCCCKQRMEGSCSNPSHNLYLSTRFLILISKFYLFLVARQICTNKTGNPSSMRSHSSRCDRSLVYLVNKQFIQKKKNENLSTKIELFTLYFIGKKQRKDTEPCTFL